MPTSCSRTAFSADSFDLRRASEACEVERRVGWRVGRWCPQTWPAVCRGRKIWFSPHPIMIIKMIIPKTCVGRILLTFAPYFKASSNLQNYMFESSIHQGFIPWRSPHRRRSDQWCHRWRRRMGGRIEGEGGKFRMAQKDHWKNGNIGLQSSS